MLENIQNLEEKIRVIEEKAMWHIISSSVKFQFSVTDWQIIMIVLCVTDRYIFIILLKEKK